MGRLPEVCSALAGGVFLARKTLTWALSLGSCTGRSPLGGQTFDVGCEAKPMLMGCSILEQAVVLVVNALAC